MLSVLCEYLLTGWQLQLFEVQYCYNVLPENGPFEFPCLTKDTES